jgi:hypothetical protein
LACALVHKVCRDGFSVLYRRAPRLFADLATARGEGRLTRLLSSLERRRLLIIDDWGPEPLNAEQRRDLLEIVDEREGKGSLLITSQVPSAAGTRYRRSNPRRRDPRSRHSPLASDRVEGRELAKTSGACRRRRLDECQEEMRPVQPSVVAVQRHVMLCAMLSSGIINSVIRITGNGGSPSRGLPRGAWGSASTGDGGTGRLRLTYFLLTFVNHELPTAFPTRNQRGPNARSRRTCTCPRRDLATARTGYGP